MLMRCWFPWVWRLLLVTPFILAIPVGRTSAQDDKIKSDVRLAVLVVFDQLRYDLLEKWEPLFGERGFKRLKKEGAWFSKCHYPYAFTVTSAGHASLVTGAQPAQHGIIANRWYDPAVGAEGKEEWSMIPPRTQAHLGVGPYRRRPGVETVGDVLLRILGLRGRTFSISIKEWAAIMMGPLKTPYCYWFDNGQDDDRAGFRRSRYYSGGEPDPKWVRDFNTPARLDRWWGSNWERLKSFDYAPHSSADDFPGEGSGYKQGRTFPHPFVRFEGQEKYKYYDAVVVSPMGNELLWDFTKQAIEHEKLGQTDKVDLLCLSFSSNDTVGHCWGPDSQEVLDMTLRTDRLVEEMLDHLDAKIGQGRWTLVISADHGVCPLPDFSRSVRKIPVEPVAADLLSSRLNKHLSDTFLAGKPAPWQTTKTSNPFIYLNRALLKEHNLQQPVVERAAADFLAKQPGIQAAYTRTQLLEQSGLDPIGKMVERSFDPGSLVDVLIVLKPYHLFHIDLKRNETYRTAHGTPHEYDTHVPLIVRGPRVRAGVRSEAVTPLAAATILTEALRLPPPSHAVEAPPGLFE
jgi:hypothetical protein